MNKYIPKGTPEKIYLDLGFDPLETIDNDFDSLLSVTWSKDNASGSGVEYVRADIANNQLSELISSVAPIIRAGNRDILRSAYLMKSTTQESYNALAESIRLEHKELYDLINELKK